MQDIKGWIGLDFDILEMEMVLVLWFSEVPEDKVVPGGGWIGAWFERVSGIGEDNSGADGSSPGLSELS